MKKLNLSICATIILSTCAISLAMENANKIMFDSKITGIGTSKPVVPSSAGSEFIKKYGISTEQLVKAAKIHANLQGRYVNFLNEKMYKFKDENINIRKSKMLNKLIRKYIKTGDLYQGISAEAKKLAAYKNYKKEILNKVVPELKIDTKYLNDKTLPRFGHYSPWKNASGKTEAKSPSTERRAARRINSKTSGQQLAQDNSDDQESEDNGDEVAFEQDEITNDDDDSGDEVAQDNSDDQDSEDNGDEVAFEQDEITNEDDDSGDEVAQGPSTPNPLSCKCCTKNVLSGNEDEGNEDSPENSMIAQDTEEDSVDDEESEVN